MSYITASNSGFSQAIISFWFKVPQASLDAADAAWTGEDGKILDGIVPLVVMGKEGKKGEPIHTEKTENVLTYTSSGTQCVGGLVDIQVECTSTGPGGMCCRTSLITFVYDCHCVPVGPYETKNGITYKSSVTGPAPKTSPSYIGVDSSGYLYVSFESNNIPTVDPPVQEISSITPGESSGSQYGECNTGTTSFGCDVLCCVCLIIECSNDADNGNGENNLVPSPPANPGTSTPSENHKTDVPGDWETSAVYSDQIKVKPDQWHHILVSVDLKPIKTHGGDWTGAISEFVDSAAQIFVALDDKNYTGWDLSSDWTGPGDNDIVSDGGWDIAGSPPDHDTGAISTYSVESSVPSGDMGMPAPATYVNNVYHCEMAEFQMWTGQKLDTAKESNRRLFLDFKRDAQGEPIPDNDGKIRLKPVNPNVAEKALGKPTVDMHGSSKWKKGTNLGTGPQFSPTGIIKTYHPDPAIMPPGG